MIIINIHNLLNKQFCKICNILTFKHFDQRPLGITFDSLTGNIKRDLNKYCLKMWTGLISVRTESNRGATLVKTLMKLRAEIHFERLSNCQRHKRNFYETLNHNSFAMRSLLFPTACRTPEETYRVDEMTACMLAVKYLNIRYINNNKFAKTQNCKFLQCRPIVNDVND
jgi:hypothetical protein